MRCILVETIQNFDKRVLLSAHEVPQQYVNLSIFGIRLYVHTSGRPHGSAVQSSTNFGKFRVPNPVTGSQPGVALKPWVPQPGFEPCVMSLNASRK